MRISDWSSDVCSSDLRNTEAGMRPAQYSVNGFIASSTPFFTASKSWKSPTTSCAPNGWNASSPPVFSTMPLHQSLKICSPMPPGQRSEEHTSELQSLLRISYAVFCLKKNNTTTTHKE